MCEWRGGIVALCFTSMHGRVSRSADLADCVVCFLATVTSRRRIVLNALLRRNIEALLKNKIRKKAL
jgi:hypothetical protein